MKKLTKLFVASLLLSIALMTSQASAQEKIGIVDVQGIFQSLPQSALIQQKIAAEFEEKVEAVKAIERDLQFYMEKQKRDTATMSAVEVEKLTSEIISLRQEYAAMAQPLQTQMRNRQAEERGRILALIQNAINDIAVRRNLDMILSVDAVMYVKNDAVNITRTVIEQVSKIK